MTALSLQMLKIRWLPLLLLIALWGCRGEKHIPPDDIPRADGAHRLEIPLSGSLQNPAFSPDGESIVFTRFREGYNTGAADLFIYDLENGALTLLVSDGSGNINLPGSAWVGDSIVFSSDRGAHDEIFVIPAAGAPGDEVRLTHQEAQQSYEPTFSPDGQWVVFESHAIDVEDDGVITKYKTDGSSGYIALTPLTDNCKQPNWSPRGDQILYQKEENEVWTLWVMSVDGTHLQRVTGTDESATDAVFSYDGAWILYSSENDGVAWANLYRIPAEGGIASRITVYRGYDGAPAISPDGSKVVFESAPTDPDKSPGTSLWTLDFSNR